MRQRIGKTKSKNAQVNVIPSIMQKTNKIARVIPKFISEETFLENRKRYLGTFTFVKIPALPRREPIPPLVESVKYEKTIFPQKIYIVKCG